MCPRVSGMAGHGIVARLFNPCNAQNSLSNRLQIVDYPFSLSLGVVSSKVLSPKQSGHILWLVVAKP